MASVFKRGWINKGANARKKLPARAESRFYSIKLTVNGLPKLIKGYTDKAATEQLAAKMERAKAQGAEGLEDPYKAHRKRRLAEHVADWIAELKQLGRDDVYVRLCESRMARMVDECKWETLAGINPESFIRWRETATVAVGHAAFGQSNEKGWQRIHWPTLKALKPPANCAGNGGR